ncbi:MAG: radical SAM protein [Candidatus Omnitrophica bacterium]|nr:radical SAM protein [Candidatus Omnitrophota bacterium]
MEKVMSSNKSLVSDSKPEKYKIHNFMRKMVQEDVFNKLVEYIDSRIKAKEGKLPELNRINPVSINIDLTTACNYLCDHCIDLELINNGGMLKVENVKKLVSRWAEGGLKSVIVIGGGEPTVYPYFSEIVSFLKSKGLELGIASNGSRVIRLAEIAPLLNKKDWMRLSLDSGTDVTFKDIHNPKVRVNLDDILSEVSVMRKNYSNFQMGYSFLVISNDHRANNKNLICNIHEIALAAEKAKKNGFSYLSVKPFIATSGSRPTEFSAKQINEIAEQIDEAKKLEDGSFKVIESVNLLSLSREADKRLSVQPKTCHIQFFRLAVCPDGIFNCTLWRGFDISRICGTKEEIDEGYFAVLRKNLLEIIESFDASNKCSEVSCIYNDFNWFVEDIINNPEKLKTLKKTENFYDYFL